LTDWKSSVGSLSQDKSPYREYLNYVHPEQARSYSKRYDDEKVLEFERILSDTSLASDDVDGVLKVRRQKRVYSRFTKSFCISRYLYAEYVAISVRAY